MCHSLVCVSPQGRFHVFDLFGKVFHSDLKLVEYLCGPLLLVCIDDSGISFLFEQLLYSPQVIRYHRQPRQTLLFQLPDILSHFSYLQSGPLLYGCLDILGEGLYLLNDQGDCISDFCDLLVRGVLQTLLHELDLPDVLQQGVPAEGLQVLLFLDVRRDKCGADVLKI